MTKEIAESLNKLGDGVDFFIIAVEGLLDDCVSVQFYSKDNIAKAKYDYFEFKRIPKGIKINIED